MTTIRWGMIGCGDVAEVKSGPGFYKAERSSLVRVMSRGRAKAVDYAARHGIAHATDDVREILADPDIDAVYIATPTASHLEFARQCAEAGKHVYVEKPMAMSHAEAMQMVAACERHGVRLWVGYYRRALPRFEEVRRLLEGGAIGDVRAIHLRHFAPLPPPDSPAAWRLDPAISGGALFFEGACHSLDLLDWLFGPIARVHAIVANQGGRYAGEDLVSACFQFESGIAGAGLWCYAADADVESSEIVGSAGRLEFSITRPTPIRLTTGGATREIESADPAHVHQPMIQAIVDELTGGPPAPSSGRSAARTASVMDRILADFRHTSSSTVK